MRVLVTGGAGFLGWHTVGEFLESRGDVEVLNLDALTYAGSRQALRDLESRFGSRHTFVRGSVLDAGLLEGVLEGVEIVVHMAAETHVDRSIAGADAFVATNVLGTQRLLDAARKAGVRCFVHTSTDEVYGHLPLGATEGAERPFTEKDPLAPRSPYAASKAGADLLCLAAWTTHGVPVVVTRGCNAYGEGQYPEKLIPLALRRALVGGPISIYGSGLQVREWVHARDQARGIRLAAERGTPGRIYNLGGGEARTNLALVREVLAAAGMPDVPVEHVSDRPGHDQRYALDGRRAHEELGWAPERTLAGSLEAVARWYGEHGGNWWG